MISRRSFLAAMTAALASPSIHAWWAFKFYLIGINDSMVNSQLSGKAKDSLHQSMSEIFEVPGNSACQFEFGSSNTLVNRLHDKEINLALLTGIEYAWIRSKYPSIEPLAVAYKADILQKACLLTRADSSAKNVLDLKGLTISLPERLQQHAYIYLQHAIEKEGGTPQAFFAKSLIPADSNEGIEGVLENKAEVILLDYDAWKGFKERKPARAKKLRVLSQSMAFPTSVIVYNKEAQSKLEVPLLKLAIFAAHEKPLARLVLGMWGIKQFVPWGPRYQRTADEILTVMPKALVPVEMVAKQ